MAVLTHYFTFQRGDWRPGYILACNKDYVLVV